MKCISSLITIGLLCFTSHAWAECSTSNSGQSNLGNISSMTLLEAGYPQTQFASGLKCEGFSLGFLNTTYLKYSVSKLPNRLINNNGNGDSIPISFKDLENNAIAQGMERDLSSLTAVSFFQGSEGNFPFVAIISAGNSVSPGTYTANTSLTTRWYYSVPALAIGGLGLFYYSPDFKRPGFLQPLKWGSGKESTISLTLTVDADCRITTNNVNFGTAPMPTEFEPVQTDMGIRCSSKTPYTVGLNKGVNSAAAGGQRAMKASTSNDYLSYELYKNHNQQRWGNTGTERWSSTDASTNAGILNGTTHQTYQFTAKVLPSNSPSLPSDTYTDTITVDVAW